MLKLPKGLKKKKKGKKSKKDKELFTEEELEQYRREHQAQASSALNSAAPSDSEDQPAGEKPSENDEEWSKFAALTTGIDTVLKKTQEDLDRIKGSSFFQKVPTKVELEAKEREEQLRREQEERELAEAAAKEAEEKKAAEELINAVVELSDSEPHSEVEEDIFDTNYTDAIASGELPLAYVPESPELESFAGPDPFDTSYAEKVIKGPEVSKRGKKIVNIGAAVEVLTGRVESVSSKTSSRRPRRGPKNLLLESFDDAQADGEDGFAAENSAPQPSKLTLLDDTDELPNDAPIDLSVSLHLALQKEQEAKKEQEPVKEEPEFNLDEFDDLKKREPAVEGDNYKLLVGEPDLDGSKKPSRPPPPRPSTGPHFPDAVDADDELDLDADDPFDTGFVERVLPATAKEDDDFDPRAGEEEEDDDFDFDPRAGDESSAAVVRVKTPDLFSAEDNAQLQVSGALTKDLLSGSNTDITDLAQTPLEVLSAGVNSAEFVDPFDTSAVNSIVAPGKTELKFLEEELLADRPTGLKHSLSDQDFDPRADSEPSKQTEEVSSIAQRKSSLCLQINGAAKNKSVVFAVPVSDLLKIDGDHSITKKPLTPYYSRESSIPESEAVDPFDTSFVPNSEPTQVELNLIEQELNNVTIKHSLSDPDFDPRAITPIEQIPQSSSHQPKSDLLGIDEHHHSHKVLTPAKDVEPEEIDPFDTSIAVNIQPGRAELKLIEDELIPAPVPVANPDILSDSQDGGAFFVKVLTPQASNSIDEADIDPFDTSFANDLGPGKTEIKLLENELIDN
ncbi:protein stoned-A [Wyeomyia smithii]|uniref:protein stoned-A n=1 Tax=Wyeomyia smithii TaxID=174621 RepID=UPI002467F111|nr:protein stoned-A [Wyeomyia smithii]XP_055528499.1 protein stoned-A [Wyeomyia smithii]